MNLYVCILYSSKRGSWQVEELSVINQSKAAMVVSTATQQQSFWKPQRQELHKICNLPRLEEATLTEQLCNYQICLCVVREKKIHLLVEISTRPEEMVQ